MSNQRLLLSSALLAVFVVSIALATEGPEMYRRFLGQMGRWGNCELCGDVCKRPGQSCTGERLSCRFSAGEPCTQTLTDCCNTLTCRNGVCQGGGTTGGTTGESSPSSSSSPSQNCEGSSGTSDNCPLHTDCVKPKTCLYSGDVNGTSAGCTCADPETFCGNGFINAGEECDDSNKINDDGCSSVCKKEICGDSSKQTNEQCDDGNQNDDDACSNTCHSRPGCTTKEECIGKLSNMMECIDIAISAPVCTGRACFCNLGFCVAMPLIPRYIDHPECFVLGETTGSFSGINGGSSQGNTSGTNGGSSASKGGTNGDIGDNSGINGGSSQKSSSKSSSKKSSVSSSLCGNGRFDIGEQCGEQKMPPCPGGAPCENCRCQSRCGDGIVNNRSLIVTGGDRGTRGFCTADFTVTSIACNPSELPKEGTWPCSSAEFFQVAGYSNEFGLPISVTCMPADCVENPSAMCFAKDVGSGYCKLHRAVPLGQNVPRSKDLLEGKCGMVSTQSSVAQSLSGCPAVEQCDDGNTRAGDGCDPCCQREPSSSSRSSSRTSGSSTSSYSSSVCLLPNECRQCATCGSGIFNICDQDECLSLGPCLYSERLNLGNFFGVCTPNPLFCDAAVICPSSSSSASSSSSVGSSTGSSLSSSRSSTGSSVFSSRSSTGSSLSSSRSSTSSRILVSPPAPVVPVPPPPVNVPVCGDGFLDQREECDDGNRINEDACSNGCTLKRCGDGVLQRGEECDDGNRINEDACSNNCTLKRSSSSRVSSRSSSWVSSSSSVPRCGDGILTLDEECDDGNMRDFDGCSAMCLLEFGYCGDGILQKGLGEMCEPRLHDPSLPYACTRDCLYLSPYCGDSDLDAGEQCDLGQRNSDLPDALCRENCSLPRCGDGILDTREQCDDKNLLNGNGCDRYCRLEYSAPPLARVTPPYPQPSSYSYPVPPSHPPVGDTGPATLAIMAAGASAGIGWVRRRRAS